MPCQLVHPVAVGALKVGEKRVGVGVKKDRRVPDSISVQQRLQLRPDRRRADGAVRASRRGPTTFSRQSAPSGAPHPIRRPLISCIWIYTKLQCIKRGPPWAADHLRLDAPLPSPVARRSARLPSTGPACCSTDPICSEATCASPISAAATPRPSFPPRIR